MSDKETVKRVHASFLSRHEAVVLRFIVVRLPSWITPDALTAIGLLGAILVCVGYSLTNLSVAWLWLASFGLVINWFGDSLDGTLARHRQIERPRYGFFVDHNVDVVSTVLIALGAGFTAWLRMDVALLLLAGYLSLAIMTFVRSVVHRRMHVDAFGFGPTEMRFVILGVNLLFATVEVSKHDFLGVTGTIWDLIALLVALFLFGLFVVSFFVEAAAMRHIDE